jgi:hypothetical protein
MEKSFGDAYEVDVSTKIIRLLTHYPHPGFLRVQYLPNGDYFLIGARTFVEMGTTRSRDQEMWILKADAEPGDPPTPNRSFLPRRSLRGSEPRWARSIPRS